MLPAHTGTKKARLERTFIKGIILREKADLVVPLSTVHGVLFTSVAKDWPTRLAPSPSADGRTPPRAALVGEPRVPLRGLRARTGEGAGADLTVTVGWAGYPQDEKRRKRLPHGELAGKGRWGGKKGTGDGRAGLSGWEGEATWRRGTGDRSSTPGDGALAPYMMGAEKLGDGGQG